MSEHNTKTCYAFRNRNPVEKVFEAKSANAEHPERRPRKEADEENKNNNKCLQLLLNWLRHDGT